jgi:taurine dioxygenase
MAIKTRKLSHAMGREIQEFDIAADHDDATIAEVRQALLDGCILLFRNQDHITPEQHIAFSKRFGALQPHALDKYLHPDYPEIFLVTNLPQQDGKPSETRNTGRQWHADLTFTPTPCMGSLLRCLETPADGGDTMFANLYLAYDALSDGMKEMLEGLSAVHSFANVRDLKNRDPETTRYLIEKNPPSLHPLVKAHPETGRKLLFLSPAATTCIDGMSEEESKPLLDFLERHATQPAFTYRHRWQVGDIIFWDNRCTNHYAPPDYDMTNPANRRLMQRTTIAA